MQVLVTGATGFLGHALCRSLREQGDSVTALGSKDADLTDDESLQPFASTRFDRIYHLAAWTQAGKFALEHPGEQWVINQAINTNLLKFWQAHQPQAKLVSMGTSCSYDPDLPLKEENYMVGTPITDLYTYALTKRMLFAGQLALNSQYGLKYLTLVPSTLYGPDYHTDGRQMHFIFDLIRKIIRGKVYGDPVTLWGNGYQKRELVLVDDFVDIARRLADNVDNDLVNIGAGTEYTIREFALLICQHVNYDFERIHFDTDEYVGATSKCLSVEKLHALLPGLELTPLSEGLAKTIDWFWTKREELLPA